MSEQAPSKTKNDATPEIATTPDAPPAAGDRELSEADLDKVAGGFAPGAVPARKAGKPQQEYLSSNSGSSDVFSSVGSRTW
jgi:hypothetical protein